MRKRDRDDKEVIGLDTALRSTLLEGRTTTIYMTMITVLALSVIALVEPLHAGAAPPAAPQLVEARASFADETSATIEAVLVPGSASVTYEIEGGSPAPQGVIAQGVVAPGEAAVTIKSRVTGLAPGSTYHYNVTATSAAGQADSSDQTLETLNSCGLPEGRCLELVSPSDPGPVAQSGGGRTLEEPNYLAAVRSGAYAYGTEGGFSGATAGYNLLYLGLRSPTAWQSTQISAPIVSQNEQNGNLGAKTSNTLDLSKELTCSVVSSTQALTDDPGTNRAREVGDRNLYRRDNATGSYEAITNIPPLNAAENAQTGVGYLVYGMTEDCRKVIFFSPFVYPGIPEAGAFTQGEIYEWDHGALRALGYVPDESGESRVPADEASAPTFNPPQNFGLRTSLGLMSESGRRVFFTAPRVYSPNAEEIGKRGVFVREDGSRTRDLSVSETAIPSGDATYQYATPDGSHMFFIDNAGLTGLSSEEGQDLYRYDLDKPEPLTDLTVTQNAGGAHIVGVFGASDDGSTVYFAAEGQLVPGQGKTLAENEKDKTASIYGSINGKLTFIGEDLSGSGGSGSESGLGYRGLLSDEYYTSRVSSSGRYFLFESSIDQTEYSSAHVSEAYLFDADATGVSPALTCVSCRQDGRPPTTLIGNAPLLGRDITNLNPRRFLVLREGRPIVFFTSFDRLANGASEGSANVYEWSHGQLFTITAEPSGVAGPHGSELQEFFITLGSANADGSDVYFSSPVTLTWDDKDLRESVYDARIGGGFPEAASTRACNPLTESACQASPPPPSTFPDPSTSSGAASSHKRPRRPRACSRNRRRASSGRGKGGGKKKPACRRTRKHPRHGSRSNRTGKAAK